jgi:hypothetical protein
MMFTGRVLALDLATTTGWAYGTPGSIPQCGHLRFSKPGTSRAATYRVFRRWLDETWGAREEIPELIVYESPAVGMHMGGKTNVDTLKLLSGLAEHLEEWAYQKTELREASVSQVRSHFIGQNLKSKIAKPMVFEQCLALGWEVETTDESDACALWHYQCHWLSPKISAFPAHAMPLFRQRPGRI